MNSNQSFRLGGRQQGRTLNQKVCEKRNPKTEKLVKIIKRTCSFCVRKKSQSFTK